MLYQLSHVRVSLDHVMPSRTPLLISRSVADYPFSNGLFGDEMNCIGFKRRIKFDSVHACPPIRDGPGRKSFG